MRLVYLPPYAPNLNLIEGFWHFMKPMVLFNRAYAKFALFKQAFAFFERLNEHNTDLDSLITDRLQIIGRADAGISCT